jgi:hypothetical protein
MQVSGSGSSPAYRSFGTGDVLQLFANSGAPNASHMLGIQQTLQRGTSEMDAITSLMAANFFPTSGSSKSDSSNGLNSLLYGDSLLTTSDAQDDDDGGSNSALQFAVGAYNVVRQLLGI